MSTIKQKPVGVDNIGRKRWNLDDYEAKARDNDVGDIDIAAVERKRQRQAGTLVAHTGNGQQQRMIQPQAVEELIAARVGKHELVNYAPAGSTAVVDKSTQGGFFCAACDTNMKDSKQYLNHLSSRRHLKSIGQSAKTERASLSSVRDRLAFHKQQKDQQEQHKLNRSAVHTGDGEVVTGLSATERLQRLERQLAQAEQQQQRHSAVPSSDEESIDEPSKDATREDTAEELEEAAMQRMMGFGGFAQGKNT